MHPLMFPRRSAALTILTTTTAWLALTAPSHASPYYSVTWLGDLPGGTQFSIAEWGSLNESGQVAGMSRAPTGDRAYIWSAATGMQNLGELPGGGDYSYAFGVNSAGQVSGYSGTATGNRAFLWSASTGMQELGELPGGANYSIGMALNDVGQVTGYSGAATGDHAYVWTAATGMQDIGELPGGANYSVSYAINNLGHVVGQSGMTTGYRPFLWTPGGGMQDLGDFAGGVDQGLALAINDVGQVAGYSAATTGTRAFLWSAASGMQDLGELPGGSDSSHAFGINNAGQVVGESSTGTPGGAAFVWSQATGMTQLSTITASLGTRTLNAARDINTIGQISGFGVNGFTQAFVLDPLAMGTTSGGAAGNVLVGTAGAANVTVTNSNPYGGWKGTFANPPVGSEFTLGSSPNFTVLLGQSATGTYNYTPFSRGSDSGTADIATNNGPMSQTLSGTGVAPVAVVGSAGAGTATRIGTVSNGVVQVINTGDGNLSGLGAVSNLNGSASGAGSDFSLLPPTNFSLADGANQLIHVPFAPTTRGAQSTTVTLNFSNGSADGQNQAFTTNVNVTGTGVGPEFGASTAVGNAINFGSVMVGGGASQGLDLFNNGETGYSDALTGMTIRNWAITGLGAAAFSLSGISFGDVISAGLMRSLMLNFNPLSTGAISATLTFFTDVGAAFGGEGASYAFSLVGDALSASAPAPGALAVMLLGLIGVGVTRRRQRATK